MARLKGTNVSNTRAFIEKTFGAKGAAAVSAAMPKEMRDALESVVAVGWYPVEVHVALLRAIEQTLGTGDGAMLRRVGAQDAEYNITRIYRMLFRLANPGYVLEKSADLWARFFDTGRWVIERPTPSSAIATLTDFAIVDPLYCTYLMAYFHRMFELVGAKSVHVHHTACRARGASACRFEGHWR
jgi:hypothetical protein